MGSSSTVAATLNLIDSLLPRWTNNQRLDIRFPLTSQQQQRKAKLIFLVSFFLLSFLCVTDIGIFVSVCVYENVNEL